MATRTSLTCLAAALLTAGCTSYVTRTDFDATINELRAGDQRLQDQINALGQKYDAIVTEVAGRIRVETSAHFASGDATVGEQDKPLLDDFARAVKTRHPGALVTVEGFTDPAGSAAFNRRLGQRRADAVRDYLVGSGGLSGDQVRAVSYGESQDRQVHPGMAGEAGAANRRVALVIDYGGAPSSPTTM